MYGELSSTLILDGAADRIDLSTGAGDLAARLNVSPAKSDEPEDCLGIIPTGPESIVLAVADGVGGAPGGRAAARLVINALDAVIADSTAGDLDGRIMAAIQYANQELLMQRRGSSTTIVVAEISDRHIRTFHVGDSEALVVGQRGKRKHTVVPHSPTGFAVQAGMLGEDEAMFHEFRHVLLNVVGAHAMRVEIAAPVGLNVRDTVLLASDGLLDNVYMSEVVEIMRSGPLSEAADQLQRLALERMHNKSGLVPSKPDDLALILFRPAPLAAGRAA